MKTKIVFDSGGYLVTSAIPMSGKIEPHFSYEEAANPSAHEDISLVLSVDSLIFGRMLEEFRNARFPKGIVCNSWYRTPAYNAKVGGIPDSLHTYACAADLATGSLSDKDWQACCDTWEAICEKYSTVGEIGRYKSYIHIGAFVEHTKDPYTNHFYIYDKR